MRILVAPQELKGTLDATAAAEAIAEGIRAVRPDVELDLAPLADGGPGTVAALVRGRSGEVRRTRVSDPLARPVEAEWALLADGSAVIEMAAASGLWRVADGAKQPLAASTFGTGELIRAALDAGATRVLVGLGGSATTDGGVGAARALGVRFLDEWEQELAEGGAALAALGRIDLSALDPRLAGAELLAATDVLAPLLGPSGAARMFARQKGATAEDVDVLEAALTQLARVTARELGGDLAGLPGAGAAGGLGFGLVAFLGARLSPGSDEVFAALELETRVLEADVVITGEGRLDAQSLLGKGPVRLAQLARQFGKRVVAFVGACELEDSSVFDEIIVAPGESSTSASLALLAAARSWATGL